MPGRGDNNKHGSAGRGASNQSNQRFVPAEGKEHPSDHNKRSSAIKTFDLNVDEVPYHVEAESFIFNDEERFNVRVNGGVVHVFAYDAELGGYRSLDDDATILPDALEENISKRLITGRS
jgi:hypothetical protein